METTGIHSKLLKYKKSAIFPVVIFNLLIDREEQDEYAVRSFSRAAAAYNAGQHSLYITQVFLAIHVLYTIVSLMGWPSNLFYICSPDVFLDEYL